MSSELPSAATGDLVRVELGPRSYEVRVVTGQIKAFGSFARGALERSPAGRSCRKALIVTDANLATRELSAGYEAALYQAGIEAVTTVVPAGESSKSLAQAARLYDELVDFQADRHTAIVALGGGVVGDLAGFVAATFARTSPLDGPDDLAGPGGLVERQHAFETLEVGAVIVGDVPSFRVDQMPYGGVKDSGLGREGLRYSIEDMTERKLLVMALK